jgi:hypothetical protein
VANADYAFQPIIIEQHSNKDSSGPPKQIFDIVSKRGARYQGFLYVGVDKTFALSGGYGDNVRDALEALLEVTCEQVDRELYVAASGGE